MCDECEPTYAGLSVSQHPARLSVCAVMVTQGAGGLGINLRTMGGPGGWPDAPMCGCVCGDDNFRCVFPVPPISSTKADIKP